jgi:hypothetical protein
MGLKGTDVPGTSGRTSGSIPIQGQRHQVANSSAIASPSKNPTGLMSLDLAVQDFEIVRERECARLAVLRYRLGAKGGPAFTDRYKRGVKVEGFSRSAQGEARERRDARDALAATSECDPCKCKRPEW